MYKKCSKCKESKLIEQFAIDKSTKSGIRSYCKKCNRDYDFRRRYNINLDLFDKMYIEQNGLCAICDKPFENRKATHLDHNHESGEVRELLCRHCNHLIGNANEDINILLSAIKYIEKWSGKSDIDNNK